MYVDEGEDGDKVESISVRNFLAARIQEINSLSLQISNTGVPSSKGLAFQHVPKHMRRRAVSHNPKRLPKRLQSIHLNQLEKSSGASKKLKALKTPSRKHRRRKSNLLLEYNRRQRENKWLETHIWHAKRFHMDNKWGYRMPLAPTDKGYRALHRAATKHCVMRDISFTSCLQLEGNVDLISSVFTAAFAPSQANPLSISAQMYKSGGREGQILFYKSGRYPFGFVGRVKFHWISGDNQEQPKLLLWVHPAQKEEILDQLRTEFELISEFKCRKISSGTEQMEIDKTATIDETKLAPKQLESRPVWKNYTTNITLTDLEGVFNRIRFYGPLATKTIKEMLTLLNTEKLYKNPGTSAEKEFWWQKYYSGTNSIILERQWELWANLSSLNQVPCNSIIPLTVVDPRISIPERRGIITPTSKAEESEEIFMDLNACDFSSGSSPLWDEDIRNCLVREKMSDAEYSRRRSKLLIPGSKVDLLNEENQIPIVLVNTTGSTGFGDGWDLILPAGWAMQFWIAFSYRSVRVCGLRDAIHIAFEEGTTHSPNGDCLLNPDSNSGQIDAQEVAERTRTKYFKYPPAKRHNFVKLGCPFPFKIEWDVLLSFKEDLSVSSQSEETFYILRDAKLLNKFRDFARNPNSDLIQRESLLKEIPCNKKCLLGVKLTILGKGRIEDGAVICLPTPDDLRLVEDWKKGKGQAQPLIEEEMKDDTKNEKERTEVRNGRDKLLKFMRKKRKRLRQRESGQSDADLGTYDSAPVVKLLNEKLDRLWLPGDSGEVLRQMSRTPIGFVVFGHPSFSEGNCGGLGYCGVKGLIGVRVVLVRNCRQSLIYRVARMEICPLS